MVGLYEAWQRARVSRRCEVSSGFPVMCVDGDDDARGRLARLVADADAVLSPSPPDVVLAWQHLGELIRWEWADTQSADRPCRLVEARSQEAGRQRRDDTKDPRPAGPCVRVRDETGRIALTDVVRFVALCRRQGWEGRSRPGILCVAGRAARAPDLGHLKATEREIRRKEQVGCVVQRESRCV